MNNANLIVVIFIALVSFGWKNTSVDAENHFNAKVTNRFRSIACIAIILIHIAELSGFEDMFFFDNIGNLWVSVFFFISGYGLYFQYKNKEDYL